MAVPINCEWRKHGRMQRQRGELPCIPRGEKRLRLRRPRNPAYDWVSLDLTGSCTQVKLQRVIAGPTALQTGQDDKPPLAKGAAVNGQLSWG